MREGDPAGQDRAKQDIPEGRTALGIELGSTRIKSVLIGEDHQPIASGSYDWENKLENGIWTYHPDDIWKGLQGSYRSLAEKVHGKYGVDLSTVGSIGISGMMHGYLVFDREGRQLVPFRTWRNTITEQAAGLLTEKFGFNIPQRWSIAHLYQAICSREDHVRDISFLTTLAGYVHWKLTGEKILGVGEASGVFPIGKSGSYQAGMMEQFDDLISGLSLGWRLEDILPEVRSAGEPGGVLTEEGARLLDPSGKLKAGIPLCPPEGDAGTGMVATNSVAEHTGNVSAGTSIFAMVVLEKELSRIYPEIDRVTTPAGKPVAMVHCNNCTSDLDAWVRLFGEVLEAMGVKFEKSDLYDALYFKALEGESDCGGLLSYNYYSGEPITGFREGRPLFVRTPDSRFHLANFSRSLLLSAMAVLRIGMDILTGQEHVRVEKMLGHGGLFKTRGVGQQMMAAALNVPVSVMESAGEGGAWGIALLAAYGQRRKEGETLERYLADRVFAQIQGSCVEPKIGDVQGFDSYMKRYLEGLAIQKAAVEHLHDS